MASTPLTLPEMPPSLKPLLGILKAASDHEKVDPVVTYWSRLYAFQMGLDIDKKSPDCLNFLTTIMAWLEKEKKILKDHEAISNELVAQAHIENHAMKLFSRADSEDRSGKAGRNTIKLFFTASQLFDTLAVFGEPSEEVIQKSKYAKWRAAYITRCLRNGETPLPPEEEDSEAKDENSSDGVSSGLPPNQPTTNETPYTPGYPTYPVAPGGPNYSNQYPVSPQPPPVTHQQPNPSTTLSSSYMPPGSSSSTSQPSSSNRAAINGRPLNPEAILKAQKLCKYAGSALQFEDINTAVDNLEKALTLLKTGQVP